MAPKNPLNLGDRQREAERMVLSSDASALRRGRRGTPRTQVFRPALIWSPQNEEHRVQSVVLDLNPQGMRLRSLERFPEGTALVVQLMRDENFSLPLSQPLNVQVMRVTEEVSGFFDYGLKVVLQTIRKSPSPASVTIPRPVAPLRALRGNTPNIRNINRSR